MVADQQTRSILKHVFRYGLTLPEFLCGSGVFEGTKREAKTELNKLAKAQLLTKAELYPGYRKEKYFRLSEHGALAIDKPAAAARPLARVSRIKCYAMAAFCCQVEPERRRRRFTREGFRKDYPQFWYSGQPTDYCVDENRLCFLKPDIANRGHWDLLIEKCQRFVLKRTSLERTADRFHDVVRAWQALVEADQFRIYVLTAFEHKAWRITERLAVLQAEKKATPPVDVFVVPGLFDLLYPRPLSQKKKVEKK